MDIAVIANPMASQFTGGAHRDVLSILSTVGDTEAMWPPSAGEATEAASQAVDAGAKVVVAMGGDGMVHHVTQALVGTNAALGIIPTGTTNVVARLLGIPSRPTRAAKFIIGRGEVRTVGLVRMDLGRGSIETTHHALFACGFGLDAEVVAKADQDPYRKYRFGALHYATTAVGVAIRSFPSTKPHIHVSDGARSANAAAVLLQFRSLYTYFGRMGLRFSKTTPHPISVLLIEKLPRHRIPRLLFDVFARRELSNVKGLDTWADVDHLEISTDPAVAAQADGEGLGLVDRARLAWTENALRVVARA